jgi:glycosyltransferase involved in cell wall biosynthesis
MPHATPVLFVDAAGERGGAEAVLLALLRHLDRDRFPPHVCCLRDGPLIDELRRRAGVEVSLIPSGSFRQVAAGIAAVTRLRDVITASDVALVHCNGTGAHIYGGLAARRAGVPSLYHVHDVPATGWSGQGLVDRLARLVPTAAAVAPSRFLAGELARQPMRAGRLLTIPNGLDADDEAGDRPGEADRGHGGAESDMDRPVAVWCGRLQRWKGPDVFLRAAAIVRRTMAGARFVVVGGALMGLDADFERELRSLVRELDLESAVRFTGHQDRTAPFLAGADVVVHSSRTPEPFGLVVLEAMLAGRAVVAPAAGGPLEIVEPGVTGLLVPPGDASGLAAAILTLFRDPSLRLRMGAAGRARARGLFSAGAMTRRFEELYAALVERADAGRGEAA